MSDYEEDLRVIEDDYYDIDISDFPLNDDELAELEDTATIELNDIARTNCEASPYWRSDE